MSTVSGTQSSQNTMSSLARSTSSTTTTKSEESRFLTLLTTQLRNQDPMNPMENAEITSQLAQMSTVDGIERLNKMFQTFLDAQGTSDSMQAAALVGHSVLVEGRKLALTSAGAVGGFEVDADADKVVLTIKDAAGVKVNEIAFDDVAAGSHNFVWDGSASDGARAADGVYTIEVAATKDGKAVKGRTLEFGTVSSIIRGPTGTDFQVGSLGIFKFDDIKQIL
ncbi:flagellar hook assembly protein FlgD [Thauera sinica]|uniref:Basal-body rod modification protein FlgD n=1 Tax=Thauera sinica TaxID=2665146 RepID=A0ABW1APE7_9RHOO|nr:flagellar hook assembly protein FlgD [Thauera sp. K11]ATE59407.1 flagellar biosynthesis protein FlgD [Thauera sp. K11]